MEQSGDQDQVKKKGLPGEVLTINKKIGITIMSKDYPIQIKYAQLEGKKSTDSYTLSVQTNLNIKNFFHHLNSVAINSTYLY